VSSKQTFATVFTHGPTVKKSLEELSNYIPLLREAENELSVMFNQDFL
jgi:hypothetical protein|tara:strand:- start:251 stop:394 length:144 start_codon:yes stop_codon:yes gene_type:complete